MTDIKYDSDADSLSIIQGKKVAGGLWLKDTLTRTTCVTRA